MSTRSSTSLPPIEPRFGNASKVSKGLPVAAERWNVEKKRIEFDEDIEKFYNAKVARCLEIDKTANEKITKLYNDTYYKVKWSNPPLPLVMQKLFTEYCKHLLKDGPKVLYPGAVDLKVWKKKLIGSVHDKNATEVEKMCKLLRDTIQKRDTELIEIQAQLISTTEKKNIKKDGTLRWMMEANVGKKDEYFTVWYLAAHGKIRELEVLLNADSKSVHIDDRDPDFGLTPLHYACKTVKLSMVQYLMSKGADIHLRTPDGRTALHLAAAYSTREVALELLGACIDFDAVDNYGCTALQIAVQNRNASTMEALNRWTTLTLLPEEMEQSNSLRSPPAGSSTSLMLSPSRSAFGTGANSIAFPELSGNNTAVSDAPAGLASEMQLTVFDDFDPSVPWEYQPIPADTLKLMSPTLSLLTKRMNAYNMYHIRTESNYVPTEMLSSRDLRNISGMLHRSANSLLEASQATSEYPPRLQAQDSFQGTSNDSVAGLLQEGGAAPTSSNQESFVTSTVDPQISHQPSALQVDTSLEGYGQYQPGNESEMFRSSYHTEEVDFASEFNECLVEIRLTTKHYALCVQENLIQEAMRSLRRRWLVAKRLWDLIVREKAHQQLLLDLQRAEQDANMAALLADHEHYQMQYDEDGMPMVTTAGLLEGSSSMTEGGDADGFQLMVDSQEAVNLSEPHPKYAPLLAEASDQSASGSRGSDVRNISGVVSGIISNNGGSVVQHPSPVPRPANVGGTAKSPQFSVDSRLDINPIIPAQMDDGEGSEDGSHASSSNGPAPPPFDLERIALCFAETQERNRLEELNPDPENQSSSTLNRPADYDSLGVPVYKVRDNVYWETESSKQRLNAPPLSEASSGLSSQPRNKQHKQNHPDHAGASSIDADEKAHELHISAAVPSDAGLPPDVLDAESEKLLTFVPTPAQESDAWAVIQKWHLVADERARRRPNFDLYLSSNDELISTSSQLTYSITESPSTGGNGASFGPDSFSKSGLDSPSNASLGSSYMLGQVQSYSYGAGPFKDKIRGNYVIKLGLDLVNVHLVRKEEGSALRILHECCGIDDEVEITQRIALLERKIDILLHIHDFLQHTVRDIESTLKPEVISGGSHLLLKLNFPMARKEVSVRTIMQGRVTEMVDVVEFLEAQMRCGDGADGNMLFDAPEESLDAHFPIFDDHGEDIPTTNLEPAAHGYGQDVVDSYTQMEESAAAAGLHPATSSSVVQFASPVDDQAASLAEASGAIQRLQKIQSCLLNQIVYLTEVSVAMHREHYQNDIAEPSTLAVALLQRARAAERAYDGAQAMRFTEQAEVAAVRALGGGSQLAISIMLETLRLYVKYRLADSQELIVISRKAVQINKYIVQFSFIDLQMADRFTQKCIEYVAISTVAIKHKETEIARQVAAVKLAAEREARRKIIEAQKGVGRKAKR